MKTLQNKVIIYDHNCPMCSLYTQGFVKWGLLEKQNRISFGELANQEFIEQVDWHRAKHEIPLIDLTKGETIYGLEALILIVSRKLPFLQKLLSCKPIYLLFSKLYNLVSYNRQIIVPSFAATTSAAFDCKPDINSTYRVAFGLIAIICSIATTYIFGQSLNPYFSITTGGRDMLLIAGTGWCVQMLLATVFLKVKRADYLSHLTVIMLLGVLVLLPGVCLSRLTDYQFPLIPLLSVLASSSLMLWQHLRRVQHLGLSQFWTFLWFGALQTTAFLCVNQLYLN